MNKIVLFYGVPSSGKLTMATMLKDKFGFKVIPNHLFDNLVKDFIEKGQNESELREYFSLITPLRNAFLNIITRSHPKDKEVKYVFTLCLFDSKKTIPACDGGYLV